MAALSGKVSDRNKERMEPCRLLERGAVWLARAASAARKGANLCSHEVARLSQFEEQVKALPVWIDECMARWEMLDHPRKPLNRERIARAQAAFKQGECEDVASTLARLQQG